MNVGSCDLSVIQINFVTEYPLSTFDVVGDVSSDALKVKLIYL